MCTLVCKSCCSLRLIYWKLATGVCEDMIFELDLSFHFFNGEMKALSDLLIRLPALASHSRESTFEMKLTVIMTILKHKSYY